MADIRPAARSRSVSLAQHVVASYQVTDSTGRFESPVKWLGLFPITAKYLPLRHLILPHPKPTANNYVCLWTLMIGVAIHLVRRAPHPKCPWRDEGGSGDLDGSASRSAFRHGFYPAHKQSYLGFRVVLVPALR